MLDEVGDCVDGKWGGATTRPEFSRCVVHNKAVTDVLCTGTSLNTSFFDMLNATSVQQTVVLL